MEDISKYYEILGLKIGATFPQVKEAYKDLVKVWHPDRFVNDPALQEKAHRKISEINTAFSKIQEFLVHLDAYHQATGGQQQSATESSTRPSEPQDAHASSSPRSSDDLSGPSWEPPKGPPTPAAPVVPDNSKSSKWAILKTFFYASLLAMIINVSIAVATGTKVHRNIGWTVAWMAMSIEAWKCWRWKALLPYPLYAVLTGVVALLPVWGNTEGKLLTFKLIAGALNVGGLIIFYLLLKKSAAKPVGGNAEKEYPSPLLSKIIP